AVDLAAFLADGRDRTFELSRRVLDLCRNQPVPPDRPEAEEIRLGLEDAQAVVRERAILERWPAYRDAYHRALDGYRAAYQEIRDRVAEEVAGLRRSILDGRPYGDAPNPQGDAVLDRYFGEGGALCILHAAASTPEDLLAAAGRHGLSAMQGIAVGLSGWRSTIEADLLRLAQPEREPTPAAPPGQKTYELRPLA